MLPTFCNGSSTLFPTENAIYIYMCVYVCVCVCVCAHLVFTCCLFPGLKLIAFSVAVPTLWNSLFEHVESSLDVIEWMTDVLANGTFDLDVLAYDYLTIYFFKVGCFRQYMVQNIKANKYKHLKIQSHSLTKN